MARSVGEISQRLSLYHGDPSLHNKRDPLDELIFIILSAKTSESSYLRTYRALAKAFPNWFDILESRRGSVSRVIKGGGLSKRKESQIRRLLGRIRDQSPTGDLSFLRKLSDEEAERFLTTLPGVGLKTARCVLMYTMNRQKFPVDTHVKRILNRIGLIKSERLTDRVQDEIQRIIPMDIRYKLHVNLVAHGRTICKAANPFCQSCVLSDICEYSKVHSDHRTGGSR